MCIDIYKVVQDQTGVVVLPNYSIRHLVFPVCPSRSIISYLNTVSHTAVRKLMLDWVNSNFGNTNTFHCNNHTFGLICTEHNKTTTDLLNDSTHINKKINNKF